MTVTALAKTLKEAERNFLAYLILIWGREKIGKTCLLAQFPGLYFISTEPGTKGLSIYETLCSNWADVRAVIRLLGEEPPTTFPVIGIDTADRAYEMCLDWVCEKSGIEYPGTDSSGEQDWGKSWRAVRKEFLVQLHAILYQGRGVVLTSHAKEEIIKTASGDRYTRIYPSMSKQARTVIEAVVDFFFYAEYVRDQENNVQRVLLTQGDELVWCGGRSAPDGVTFPPVLPLLAGPDHMEERVGYQVLVDAFQGKDVGIDPSTLRFYATQPRAGKKSPPQHGASKLIRTLDKKGALQKTLFKKPKKTPPGRRGKDLPY